MLLWAVAVVNAPYQASEPVKITAAAILMVVLISDGT